MVMEHAEALERIEIAAVEPEGLERLMAGDTPDAAAVAGHLAGCPSCAEELVRIRRTSAVAREVIHSEPDPAMKERTLAFVRAVGRDRSTGDPVHVPEHPPLAAVPEAVPGAVAAPASAPAITVLPAPAGSGIGAEPVVGPAASASARRPRRGWALLAVAAAVVIAVGVGYAAGGAAGRSNLEARATEVAILGDATATAMRIQAEPDAQHVQLLPTAAGAGASGSLAFSPSSGELVAVATGLTPEAANEEYGCWVEVDGERHRLGKMYWAGELWTWAGPVEGLAALPPGAVFGVSLNDDDGAAGEPVLTGSL
jgi:hypothetical protein